MTKSNRQHPRDPKAKQQDLPLSWDEQGAEASPAVPAEDLTDARKRSPEDTGAPEPPTGALETPPAEPEDETPFASGEPDGPTEDRPPPVAADARVVRLAESGLELGQALMEARGARNLTVAEVCQRTRIAREFIEALEGDDIEQLPAPVYTRSYIRQLCSDYGIDPTPLVGAYEAMVGGRHRPLGRGRFVLASEDDDVSTTVQYTLRSAGEDAQTDATRRPTAWLVGLTAALVILVTAVAWGVRSVRERTAAADRPAMSVAPAQPAVDLEEFITPQQLPLKELPLPSSQPD